VLFVLSGRNTTPKTQAHHHQDVTFHKELS